MKGGRPWRAGVMMAGLALLSSGRRASAEDAPVPTAMPVPVPTAGIPFGPTPPAPPAVKETPRTWEPPITGIGTGVLLGGGVWKAFKRSPDWDTGLGGSWDLRMVAGTRRVLALELAYVGSASDVRGPAIADDVFLLRNGVEGGLRLNGPIVRGSGMIAPFACAGVGWNRFNLIHAAADITAVGNRDDVLTFPVGGGLSVAFRTLLVEARFTYRPVFGDDLFGGADMRTWNVGLSVGGEF